MPSLRYQQVEDWIRQGIREQRWHTGERLPSIRTLCQQFDVSKITVQHAFQRLEAQRLIEARPRSGYFVLEPDSRTTVVAELRLPVSVSATVPEPSGVTVHTLLLDVMERGAAFDVCPPAVNHTEPDPLDANTGQLPRLNARLVSNPADARQRDAGLTALNRSLGRALRRQQSQHHSYYDQPAGDAQLRFQIVERYRRRATPLDIQDICITNGCQHSLFLALMSVCKAGDVVAVEAPGFYGVLQLLEQLQLNVIEIPASAAHGMDMDALAQALMRWPIQAVVITPAFATPTGALLPDNARRQLMALAEQHDLAIIEDDIYAETAFNPTSHSGAELLPSPLKALDYRQPGDQQPGHQQRVILCGSYSKCLSKDLRLGWIAGGRWHEKILRLKLVSQLASSRSQQQGLADFIEDGGLLRHLKRYRQTLRQQRDELLHHLRDWPIDTPAIPEGGLTLWLTLPDAIETLPLYQRAQTHGVAITPGPLFSASGQFQNNLRLSYAHPWTSVRIQALQTLRDLIEDSA